MKVIRRIFFFTLLLLSPHLWAENTQSPLLDEAPQGLSMLRDPGGQLDIQSVAQPEFVSDFASTSTPIVLSKSQDAIWLRFNTTLDPTQGDKLLEVTPAALDAITLYALRANGTYQALPIDKALTRSTAALPHRHVVFVLKSAYTGPQTYFLRVQSSANAHIGLHLWYSGDLIQASTHASYEYGIYLGVVLLIIAYNLSFWFGQRNRLHLVYSIYLLLNCLSLAILSGHAEFGLPDWPGLADRVQQAMVLLHIACITIFFGWLFAFPQHLPRLFVANIVIVLVMALYGILIALGLLDYRAPAVNVVGLLQIAVIALGAFRLSWQKDKKLAFYAVAFIASLLFACLPMLLTHGWAESHPYLSFLPLLASALHMLLVNLGIDQRVRHAERERKNADRITLSMSQQNERELERRVIQRTRALEKANAALKKEVEEREELQAQLHAALAKEREAMASQRQFVAMVSHEFRTPLAIIDATAQRVLLQHGNESSALVSPMNKIRRGVQRLTDLIDNFLGEERLPQQGHNVVNESLDLTALAQKCVEQHRPLSSGVIHCTQPAQPTWVTGDNALLTLVLSNLIDNALKYSPSGSPITIRVDGDSARCWVDVIDYGVGISKVDQERIFDKHVRLGHVSGVVGTGLGLHIARNAARRMGGDIQLASAVGQGSCFRLWLPRAKVVQPQAMPQQ